MSEASNTTNRDDLNQLTEETKVRQRADRDEHMQANQAKEDAEQHSAQQTVT